MRSCCTFLLSLALASDASPQTLETANARAIDQIQSRDFNGAVSTLRPFLDHADPTLCNLLGIAESELHHTAAARQAFEKGLALDPASISLNENLGFLYFQLGDYRTADKYLAKAISNGSDKPGVAFSHAASLARTGHDSEALNLLDRLEPSLSNQPDYWAERGSIELRLRPAAAAASFDRALTLAPADLRALNGAASAAEASHQDEKALSYLLRARNAGPGDIATLLHFGSLCLRRDLSVDARDALQHAYTLAPQNNLALFLYARVQIAFQQWQQAHDLFTAFDTRVPNYAPAQFALGWLDLKLNRPAEARRHLEKSLALDPANPDVRSQLGQLDLDEGNLDAARTQLRAVLDTHPAHAKANIAFGDLMIRQGDLQQARVHYETAISADPRSGPAHYKLSTVLMRQHDTERAARERALGAELNAEAEKAGKVVLVLANPAGERIE